MTATITYGAEGLIHGISSEVLEEVQGVREDWLLPDARLWELAQMLVEVSEFLLNFVEFTG